MLFLAPSFSFRALDHFPLFVPPIFIYFFLFRLIFLYPFLSSVLLFCPEVCHFFFNFIFLLLTPPFHCSCYFSFILLPALFCLKFLCVGYILCLLIPSYFCLSTYIPSLYFSCLCAVCFFRYSFLFIPFAVNSILIITVRYFSLTC
jgi:hypothetical protein